MAKRRVIDDWELGTLFGEHVIRGVIDGERVLVPWRWWSHGRFGISYGQNGTDEILAVGNPGRDAR